MAHKALELFGKPDLLVSSTANRAFTTATVFKDEMKLDISALKQESNLYHASMDDMLDCISLLDEDVKYAMLFGHNPTTTYLANSFPGAMIDNVPTCGVIILESTADNWLRLDKTNTKRVAFIYPKMYV